MSFLYHFRVLELSPPRVRVRVWITSPDVLAWGAKALPRNTKNLLNTQHFATLLLREQLADGDAWTVGCAAAVDKAAKAREKALAAGKPAPPGDEHVITSAFFGSAALRDVASLEVTGIEGFPPPKAAWDPKTPAAKAQYEAYWAPWRAWDGSSDPPANLARFDLAITLKDPASMPTGWPAGVKGTTAHARA